MNPEEPELSDIQRWIQESQQKYPDVEVPIPTRAEAMEILKKRLIRLREQLKAKRKDRMKEIKKQKKK